MSIDQGPSTIEVWAGPLSNGGVAVILLNRSLSPQTFTAKWFDIGVPADKRMTVRDLWCVCVRVRVCALHACMCVCVHVCVFLLSVTSNTSVCVQGQEGSGRVCQQRSSHHGAFARRCVLASDARSLTRNVCRQGVFDLFVCTSSLLCSFLVAVFGVSLCGLFCTVFCAVPPQVSKRNQPAARHKQELTHFNHKKQPIGRSCDLFAKFAVNSVRCLTKTTVI